jgi:acetyltransferase-like isoleucine patch superfamily enzyme
VQKLVARLKGDPTYRLDTRYSTKQLFFIIYYRFFQSLRGTFLKLKISSDGLVFCGSRVVVQHGYQLTAGKSLILEEGVHINALSENGIVLGNNVTIARYAVLSCTGVIANKGMGISIGNNSAVGAQSYLGGQGGITIGNDVIMGPQVKIFSENHQYKHPNELIRKQGESRQGVHVGDNCWIGAGVTILDGVHIANGCVVAAGSVVTKSVPENSFLAGVPARVVRSRSF